MKQLLLFPVFILCTLWTFSIYSQTTYKIDEQRVYSGDDSPDPDWEQNSTMQYTYDNEGDKETNLLILLMPGSQEQYQNNKTYNATNHITMDVGQFYNPSTLEWQDISRTLYEYDVANNLTMETSQTYNFLSMVYVNSTRTVNTYSGTNLMTQTTQFWSVGTSAWINNSKDINEYSGADLTQQISQGWNSGTSNWDNEDLVEITYASTDKPSQAIYSRWNTGTGMWDLDERDTATYSMDLISEVLYEIYIGSTWELDGRSLFTYVDGLETELLSQDWDGSEWINEDRDLITYDGNGNDIVNIYEEWDEDIMEWIPASKIEKDFSVVLPFTLSTDSFEIGAFKVYPNPASDILNISSSVPIERMELFDVLGKKLMATSYIQQLNVAHLKSGTYILKVFNNNRSATKQIVIK